MIICGSEMTLKDGECMIWISRDADDPFVYCIRSDELDT
jgi:hypothetical protein